MSTSDAYLELPAMNDISRIEKPDDELLAVLASAQEGMRFVSNPGKQELERWVVGEFLRLLQATYTEDDIHSKHQISKTDVEFREACFQIKEILSPGAKPYADARYKYEFLKVATMPENINNSFFVYDALPPSYDIPSPTTIYALVSEEAHRQSMADKYLHIKAELDLLVYVTRTRAALVKQSEIDLGYLSSLGWRSISCLAGRRAKVLFASRHAPPFLRAVQNVC